LSASTMTPCDRRSLPMASPDRVATAGAYVLIDGFVAFMVGVARATGDRLVVIRLGGHREAEETAWDCAAREVLEEASLVIHPLMPPATYWVEPDQDPSAPFAAPWQRPPGEDTDPLLVATRHEVGARILSVTYFAGAQGTPVPANEAQGLLLLRRSELLRLVREPVTRDEFLRSGGRTVLHENLPTNLPLEPFLQLRALATLIELHPQLVPD
jgi:8-oxo-dGTP pyrophosphatase MutT (NUDIX family)